MRLSMGVALNEPYHKSAAFYRKQHDHQTCLYDHAKGDKLSNR